MTALPPDPSSPEATPSARQQYAILWDLARPHKRALSMVALIALAGSATTLTIPWLAGHIAGDVIEAGTQNIGSTLALLVLALVVSCVFSAVGAIYSAKTVAHVLADLRVHLYNHVQSLPIGWYNAKRQGDILALITSEVEHLGHFLTSTLVGTPPLLLTAAGAAVLMLKIDLSLALLVPILVPAYMIILKLVGRKLRRLAELQQDAEAQIVATAESNLSVISAIKSFSRENIESRRYQEEVNTSRYYSIRLARIECMIGPVSTLITGLAALALLVTIGDHLHQGHLSGQELFSFLFYAALLTSPVSELADTWGQIQVTRGTLSRMVQVLSMSPEPGHLQTNSMPRPKGDIRFSHVDFAYPSRSPLFKDFNIHIRAGEKIAVLGTNGAGKSTLVALLLRFYEVQKGRITIDNQDIAQCNVQTLRSHIAIVPQRPLLISASVADNIRFGRQDASWADIQAAAVKAGAWDFIENLPQGMETPIGDNGVRLSGGQGQRIALARALLKDAPIVVLDEATSMYDPQGEEEFVTNCTRSLTGKTVLIITHRPASVALADRVLHIGSPTSSELEPA